MRTFLHHNIGFFSILGICLAAYLAMLIYSGGMEGDLATANTTLKTAQDELDDELSRQGEFNDVADNLKIGLVDLEALAKSRKTELEELRAILSRQGLLSDSDRQSSQDVNSDLQSFIRLYRDKLPKKGIKIKGSEGGLGTSGFNYLKKME